MDVIINDSPEPVKEDKNPAMWVLTNKDQIIPEGPYAGYNIGYILLRDAHYIVRLIEEGHYKPSWQVKQTIDTLLESHISQLELDSQVRDPASYETP
jgi:hypothetical protein